LRLPAASRPPLLVRDAVVLARRELAHGREQSAVPPDAAPVAPTRAVFRRAGEVWEVEYANHAAHLRPSKGLDDLARLLAQPGREIHCLELAGAAVVQSSTGEVIDASARRAYEQRVRDLQADIDEAEADHDLARAERARVELDLLVDQLTAALGLGRKARRSGETSERTRSAVTQRVRVAIRRIDEAHPRLARHLDASVRTGTYCVYQPEESVHWLL
jgi:hypothetical protein